MAEGICGHVECVWQRARMAGRGTCMAGGRPMHETHPLKSVACILLECILVTTDKVWGKVMFLHLSVILFTLGCAYSSMQWGRHTPWADTSLGRHNP